MNEFSNEELERIEKIGNDLILELFNTTDKRHVIHKYIRFAYLQGRKGERNKHKAEKESSIIENKSREDILKEVECRVVDAKKKEWWLEVVYKVGTPEMKKKYKKPKNTNLSIEEVP